MSIQKKVALVLLGVLLVVAGIIFFVVYSQTSQVLNAQAEHEISLLKESSKQQAYSVFQSLVVGTKSSVEEGEMGLFDDLLNELSTVDNIAEIGLTTASGKIGYSSKKSNVGNMLDGGIFQTARQDLSGKIVLHELGNKLVLIRSQVFTAKCIECHDDNKVGDLGGVLFLDYDLTALHAIDKDVEKKLAAGLSQGAQSMVLTGVVGGFVAIVIIYYILGVLIRKPLVAVGEMFDAMADGKFDGRLNLERNDEIGNIGKTLDSFCDLMEKDVLVSLQKLADGDISFDVVPHSSDDSIRIALKKVSDDLNSILCQIQGGATQIASGASQIADSSQSLSEGATDSASSVEEISASMNELTSQTKINADNAQQANVLATQVHAAADKGNSQMRQMVTAMTDINESSLNISKIIKVIDEIAFQTNLLALNAAVEAARAGQHGKGFAVVAEEVRNLAARSAKAAQETATLIESSVERAEHGAAIANNTAEAFGSIVDEIQKVNDLISEISSASVEQANGLAQVNDGVSRIDDVTQQNTANAEQGAASAEQLSSQAAQLDGILSRFKLKQGGAFRQIRPPAQIATPAPAPTRSNGGWGGQQESASVQIALDDSDFGKF